MARGEGQWSLSKIRETTRFFLIYNTRKIGLKAILLILNITRMTTFIKTKFKISDDQTNIDKYRLAANNTVYHIISKLILQRIIITNFCGPVSHLR